MDPWGTLAVTSAQLKTCTFNKTLLKDQPKVPTDFR